MLDIWERSWSSQDGPGIARSVPETPKLRGNAVHFIRVDDLYPGSPGQQRDNFPPENNPNEFLLCGQGRGIIGTEIESLDTLLLGSQVEGFSIS